MRKYVFGTMILAGLVVSSFLIWGYYYTLLDDDFDATAGWEMFEEIVGGDCCYGSSLGDVSLATDASRSGEYSLRVWANMKESNRSNHVIAGKKLEDSWQSGKFRYDVCAFIDPNTTDDGQTGPELSIQNTREDEPGSFYAYTAAIQYRSYPTAATQDRWAIWQGADGWQEFDGPLLSPGEWYCMRLTADYDDLRYSTFRLRGANVDQTFLFLDKEIKRKHKPDFGSEAFVVTAEAQNIYTCPSESCESSRQASYRVFYDDIRLRKRWFFWWW